MAITKLQDSEEDPDYEKGIERENRECEERISVMYNALLKIPGSDTLTEYNKKINETHKDRAKKEMEFQDLILYLANIGNFGDSAEQVDLSDENKIHAQECFSALEKLLQRIEFPTTTDVADQWFKDACLKYGFNEETAEKLKIGDVTTLRENAKKRFLEPLSKAAKQESKILEIIVEACSPRNFREPGLLDPVVMLDILQNMPQRTNTKIDWSKIKEIVMLPHETVEYCLDHHFANPEAPVEALRYMQMFTKKQGDLGYTLKRYIASGANKHVFEAEDPQCPEDKVVVKIFNLREVKEYMERRGGIVSGDFLHHEKRAAYITRKTRAPDISMVTSIESLDENGTYYIIEEQFDETLEDYIEKWQREQGNKIGIPKAFPLVKKICHGVNSLHKESLVHGDLKASNIGLVHSKKKRIILGCEDVINIIGVKITDCGYATSFKYNPKDKTFSFAGLSIRAPELYSEDKLVQPTAKSDIWAIGVLTYYMLTGEYPFVHPSKTEKEQNWRKAERMVLDDIKYKLADPDERLFNRREFVDPIDATILHYNPRIFINACLQLEPEKRPDILNLILD